MLCCSVFKQHFGNVAKEMPISVFGSVLFMRNGGIYVEYYQTTRVTVHNTVVLCVTLNIMFLCRTSEGNWCLKTF